MALAESISRAGDVVVEFWALVLGFTISGVLQVFVSKEQMSRAFGRTNLTSVATATGLGAVLWVLMGWWFVIAELAGAIVLIALLWALIRLFLPKDIETEIRGVIGGFLAILVARNWWEVLFLQTGPLAIRLIENALVGPIIALLPFVCSVGNIPLASLLWSHGISFGGVISFIYGDLIVIPIIIIYVKYYGV